MTETTASSRRRMRAAFLPSILADYGKWMDCYRPRERPRDRGTEGGAQAVSFPRRILMSPPPPHFAQHEVTLLGRIMALLRSLVSDCATAMRSEGNQELIRHVGDRTHLLVHDANNTAWHGAWGDKADRSRGNGFRPIDVRQCPAVPKFSFLSAPVQSFAPFVCLGDGSEHFIRSLLD